MTRSDLETSTRKDVNEDKLVLIITHSREGFTDNMANAIARGVRFLNTKPLVRRVNEVALSEIAEAAAAAFGTPVYLDYMSGELKTLFDNCHYTFNKHMSKNPLERKPGAVFANGRYKGYVLKKLQFRPTLVKTLEHIVFRNLKMRKVTGGIYFATHLKSTDPRNPLPLTSNQEKRCQEMGRKLAHEVRIQPQNQPIPTPSQLLQPSTEPLSQNRADKRL